MKKSSKNIIKNQENNPIRLFYRVKISQLLQVLTTYQFDFHYYDYNQEFHNFTLGFVNEIKIIADIKLGKI